MRNCARSFRPVTKRVHTAMRRQALIGKADPQRLHPVFRAQIQPYRLVRRLVDGIVCCNVYTINDAKRCASWRSLLFG